MPQERVARERVDDRLARLLQVEQRLEQRERQAERDARARVEAVRAAALRSDERRLAEIHHAAQEEERADLARHAAELARIQARSAEQLSKLSSLTDEGIERLARWVCARVIGKGGAP